MLKIYTFRIDFRSRPNCGRRQNVAEWNSHWKLRIGAVKRRVAILKSSAKCKTKTFRKNLTIKLLEQQRGSVSLNTAKVILGNVAVFSLLNRYYSLCELERISKSLRRGALFVYAIHVVHRQAVFLT